MDATRTIKQAVLLIVAGSATLYPCDSRAAILSADTTSVTLSAAPGSTSQSANVTISTTSSDVVTLGVSVTPKNSWLVVYYDSLSLVNGYPATFYIVGEATNYSSPTVLHGTITFSSQGSSVQIDVTFNVGSGGGTPTGTLVPSQSSVAFAYPPGAGGSNSTQIRVNATDTGTTAFNASATTQSGGQWLILDCQSSCTNQSIGSQFAVKVDAAVAATLAAGSYQGTVTLTNSSSSSDQATVSVTLSVNQAPPSTTTLLPSQSRVSFSYSTDACGTSSTQIMVNAATGSNTTAFSAVSATQSGGQWLILSCQNDCSSVPVGTQLVLKVDPAVATTLSTGVYQATVTLTNTANSSDATSISVALAINTAITTGTSTASLAAPASLSFPYSTVYGGALPFQTILISGSNPSVIQSSNGSFPCGVNLSYALAGNTVLVAISGSGFQLGNTYSGWITVSSSLGTQTIPIAVSTFGGPTLSASPGSITCQPNQGICPGNTLSFQMSDGTTRALTVTSSAPWVSLEPAGCGNATPASCTVVINQNGLAGGLNTATVTATAPGAVNSAVSVPVVVLMSGVLSLSNNALTFTASAAQQQSLTVSAGTATNFGITFGVDTPAGGDWLSATASATTTPATITVAVNPAGLLPGQYSGHVSLTAAGSTPQLILVSLTVPHVTGGNISVSSITQITSLTFSAQSGGPIPAAQQIVVSSASGTSDVAFSYNTSSNWLLVNNAQSGQSTTPATLSVSINPANLTAGMQTGTITIMPAGGQTVTIIATVTVAPAVAVSAAPSSISLAYMTGSKALPPTAQIQVSGSGAALPFTAVADSTGQWLAVSPPAGTTVAGGTVTLTVSLQNLDTLPPSVAPYTGIITIAGAAGAGTVVNVSLTVRPPLPTIVTVANAASLHSGPISPGEVITILGTALGPEAGVSVTQDQIVDNQMPTALSGVQVFVNGFAAPVLYVSATQISAIVPYEISSSTSTQAVNLQVKYLGQSSNGFALVPAATAPGIFTANSSGSGPAAALNADGSTNFWRNPANRGDQVTFFVTGEGQTNPAGVSGRITSATTPLPQPVLPPSVTINGTPARVVFYSETPGMAAGTLQINVEVPANVPSGDLPVVVSLGTVASQFAPDGTGAVTVSVR